MFVELLHRHRASERRRLASAQRRREVPGATVCDAPTACGTSDVAAPLGRSLRLTSCRSPLTRVPAPPHTRQQDPAPCTRRISLVIAFTIHAPPSRTTPMATQESSAVGEPDERSGTKAATEAVRLLQA